MSRKMCFFCKISLLILNKFSHTYFKFKLDRIVGLLPIPHSTGDISIFNGGEILKTTVNPQGLGTLDAYWRN